MAVFWGGSFVAGRAVAGEVPPFSAAFLRFACATLVLGLYTLFTQGSLPRPRPGQLLQIIVLGLTGVFAFNFFFFAGLADINASRAAMIVALNPALIALASSWLFKEKMGWAGFGGVLLCVAGALVVISRGHPWALFTAGIGRGELYILAACASWVVYSLIGKVTMRELSPLTVLTYACLLGTVALVPPAVYWGGLGQGILGYGLGTWAWLAFAGVPGAALAYLWFYEGIRKIGPSRTGTFISLVPICTVLLAWLLLGEPVEMSLALGAGMVTAGLILTNQRPAVPKPAGGVSR